MSDFGSHTTADEVLEGVDLTGRRVVITGAATGLGRESARALAAHGAAVTVLARSEERAAGAVAELEARVPGATFESGVVDLADLASVRSFADTFLDTHDAVDVLINNAGVMACPFGRTADGFETQFGTNHLGHFLLTALLTPALLRGTGPRVVTLSSAGHSRADVDLVDPNFLTTDYSAWVAYGQSKIGQRPVRTRALEPRRASGTAVVRRAPRWDHDRPGPPPRRRAHERDDRLRPGPHRGCGCLHGRRALRPGRITGSGHSS